MKFNKDELRLLHIKKRYILFPAKCDCCNNIYRFTKMYHVNRWGPNKRIVDHYYCLNCMHSAQDVLSEIDSDEIPFGIAGIDDFWRYSKKDNTRMEIRMQKLIESKQKNKKQKKQKKQKFFSIVNSKS